MSYVARARPGETYGLVRLGVDAHTLGLAAVRQLLSDTGHPVDIVSQEPSSSALHVRRTNGELLTFADWIRSFDIAHIGFSFRLDPDEAVERVMRIHTHLRDGRLLDENGGRVRGLFFAGLPSACRRITEASGGRFTVFLGDESALETIDKLGVAGKGLAEKLARDTAYDGAREQFARRLIGRNGHEALRPPPRGEYPQFGTFDDTLVARLADARRQGGLPLMRAHVGPYSPNRTEALAQFNDWCRQLGKSGFLDILSIGTSQLSQSHFGQDWRDLPNGGGVPLNSTEELRAVWEAARPMLVRTYAGTTRITELATVYEQEINCAWHTLSLWWFNKIDARGPLSLRDNLAEHLKTIAFVAKAGKPFEANVPHHFAFRGADDVTYVLSAVLAARVARRLGIRHYVFQNMLNTPKATWGIADLAKSRACLTLLRELEGPDFTIILQPRAGLDYFSHDLDKAKVQLAMATMLMDDIEPGVDESPQIIHVVSYSEASHLADPPIINESIQITRHALASYREARRRGEIDDMSRNKQVDVRTAELVEAARTLLELIEKSVPDPYSAGGLARIFEAGFLPVPSLMFERDRYPQATRYQTMIVDGSVKLADEKGTIVPPAQRGALASWQAGSGSPLPLEG